MVYFTVNNTGVRENYFDVWNETIVTDKGNVYEELGYEVFSYDRDRREATEAELGKYRCPYPPSYSPWGRIHIRLLAV